MVMRQGQTLVGALRLVRQSTPPAVNGVVQLYADQNGDLRAIDADGSAIALSGAPGLLTLPYAASINIDLDPGLAPQRRIAVAGNLALTTSNRAADGRGATVILDATALVSTATLTVPVGWRWFGNKVTSITPGQIVILSLSSQTALDTGTLAAAAIEVP